MPINYGIVLHPRNRFSEIVVLQGTGETQESVTNVSDSFQLDWSDGDVVVVLSGPRSREAASSRAKRREEHSLTRTGTVSGGISFAGARNPGRVLCNVYYWISIVNASITDR